MCCILSFAFSFQGTIPEESIHRRSPIAQLVEHSTVNRVVTGSSPVRGATSGEVSEWSKEHDWKSCRRGSVSRVRIPLSPPSYARNRGPLVKGLRHLPFTEVTGVRIPYGSPSLRALSSAGRASALQAEGRRFDPVSAHHMNIAGWSSPVARRAHNPKVVGSNPAPATNFNAEPWCRGLTCLPVTQETAGSNPVGSAIFTTK